MRISLQRHLSALPKFTPAKSRVCGRQRPGIVVPDTFVNLCVKKHVRISVAVGFSSDTNHIRHSYIRQNSSTDRTSHPTELLIRQNYSSDRTLHTSHSQDWE